MDRLSSKDLNSQWFSSEGFKGSIWGENAEGETLLIGWRGGKGGISGTFVAVWFQPVWSLCAGGQPVVTTRGGLSSSCRTPPGSMVRLLWAGIA